LVVHWRHSTNEEGFAKSGIPDLMLSIGHLGNLCAPARFSVIFVALAGQRRKRQLGVMPAPRLATRGLLLLDNRLLLVNAWSDDKGSDLWCAPGGGVERGQSLHDNLIREFHEETGLTVAVGAPCLVNEFHDPNGTFHQVDIYFHVKHVSGQLSPDWRDPEGVVTRHTLVTREELRGLRVKPDTLAQAAWETSAPIYDPLEPILR